MPTTIALLSHSHKQMQEKTTRLEQIAAQTGLRINSKKTKVMKILSRNMEPIKLSTGIVEEVQQFTYLGSIVSTDGGTEEDVKARLWKARVAFHMLDKLWKSKIISRHTKLKIFNSNVK